MMEVTWRYGESQFPGFEADARALAKMHASVGQASGFGARAFEPFEERLAQARTYFEGKPSRGTEKTAECFLRHYDLIRGAARQVAAELPRELAARLPRLTYDGEPGWVRVEVLATAFVVAAQVEVEPGPLQRFVRAYQEVTPLTNAELWALPTMLRHSVLRALVSFLRQMRAIETDENGEPAVGMVSLLPARGVEYSIRALQRLAEIDWRSVFEATSLVESVLRKDTAYAQLDFAARHACRQAVEELAWDTGWSEEHVSERAILLGVSARLGGDGRAALERGIDYRPPASERVRRELSARPRLTDLGSFSVLTAIPLLAVASLIVHAGGQPFAIAMGTLLALLPTSLLGACGATRIVDKMGACPPRVTTPSPALRA
ncbi:hypothetical protein LZC95_33460 [Pendulispora brunnea]|uniref:Uncharacterized protein n=1 Tax=Pendulispora brunnea TaxID=2905690 RepID=A0ABZ2JY08_9BACT